MNADTNVAILFVELADGKNHFYKKAPMTKKGKALVAHLIRRKLLVVREFAIDGQEIVEVRLTERGLATFDRAVSRMLVTVEKVRPTKKPFHVKQSKTTS